MSLGSALWNNSLGLLVRIPRKLVAYRELLWNLTIKEIRIRYKQSLLGIAWAVFIPVTMMLLFTFIFKRIAKIDLPMMPGTDEPVPYPIFNYIGVLPWNFFSQSLSGCVTTMVSNRNLVTKLYFPREVFPLSKIFSMLLDLGIGSLVLVGLMFFYGFPMQWTIVFVPLLLLIQILFMLGCGLLLSMANLFYRDVQYVFQVGIQLWMFASAVLYPLDPKAVGSKAAAILWLNPMTPIIDGYRKVIILGQVPEFGTCLPALLIVVGTLWLGLWAFDRAQYLFAERI